MNRQGKISKRSEFFNGNSHAVTGFELVTLGNIDIKPECIGFILGFVL